MEKFVAALVVILAVLSQSNAKKYDKWCCKSNREYVKCQELAVKRKNNKKVFDFNCVRGASTDDCIAKIKNGTADMIILDAGDILDHKDSLKVVAAENVGLEDASYYAVAAVLKTAEPGLNLNTVTSGRYSTCHTGVGKTAGWNMPMGYFARRGMDSSKIVASCAPGANLDKYKDILPGGPDPKWCQLCVGDQNGADICARNNDEHFYGYEGALECINTPGFGGDVAFIKHSTIEPAKHDDYELLCQDGTRKKASEWAFCNLGRVPSHALVVNGDATDDDAEDVFNRLKSAWDELGDDRHAYDRTFIPATKNLLWGSSVTSFTDYAMKDVTDYLGRDYMCNLKAARDGASVVSAECNLTV